MPPVPELAFGTFIDTKVVPTAQVPASQAETTQ
jgi:hypothetical protein